MFSGYTGISLSVSVSVCLSVLICQSAHGGINLHLVTALVFTVIPFSLKIRHLQMSVDIACGTLVSIFTLFTKTFLGVLKSQDCWVKIE